MTKGMEEMGPKANARSSPSCHAIWAKKLAYPGTKQKSYPQKTKREVSFYIQFNIYRLPIKFCSRDESGRD